MGELEITLRPKIKDHVDIEKIRVYRNNNAIIIVVPGCSETPDIHTSHLDKSTYSIEETRKRIE